VAKNPVVIPGLTIAAGEALSNAIDVTNGTVLYFVAPSEWDAANISFQISPDNETFVDLFQRDGTEVILPVRAASCVYVTPPLQMASYLKIRSGTRDRPIPQRAQRDFVMVVNQQA
jgi:hypothetical protein